MRQPGTFLIASMGSLLLGVLLGVLLFPRWMEHDQVAAIASADFHTREDAWSWWRSGSDPLPLDELNATLELAPPDAFLHGVEQLRRMRRWGWNHQPRELMERHLELLTWRSHVLDIEDAIDLVDTAPMTASNDAMIHSARSLLAHPDEQVANDAYRAFVSWSGFRPTLGQILDALPEHRAAWALPYRYWQTEGLVPLALDSPAETVTGSEPGDGAIEMVLAWTRARSIEDIVLEKVKEKTLMPDPTSRRDTAMAWLHDEETERDVEDTDHLGPGVNRRIAGAILAAHEGLDPAVIEAAMHMEEDARVRTVMRLARDVVGPPWNDQDPGEFAMQALRDQDEGDSLYPVVCRMIAGDTSLLGPRLASAASGSWPDRIRCLKLITWLKPGWVDLKGRWLSGEEPQAGPFFSRLQARWHLERRWLVNSTTTPDDGSHD